MLHHQQIVSGSSPEASAWGGVAQKIVLDTGVAVDGYESDKIVFESEDVVTIERICWDAAEKVQLRRCLRT